ncbi:MATE family efflux transporter [Ramlibacter albus]|uniref:MATE family efflux transporter n=1 Tax=Ramlibacter albus TaxID=2079448 RepID=A0A923M8N7_9BURK|nr:MATE family efflux transporter [Ramlibacter albus]MBC5766332.1 MATE family efflux transporter [Ramlibacter albus]
MDPASASATLAPRTRMLLQAPVTPTLLRLAVPNILNLLAFVGLITFDGLFVGRLGLDALAGISLVFPWVMLMQHGAASGMGQAVSSAVARSLGAGDRDKADALAAHALWLALGLGALSAAVMLPLGGWIYGAMGGRGPVLEAALAYSNVIFAGAVSIWAMNLLGNVMRGTGDMKTPAAVILACVVGHVALSPVLIFGWGPVPALGVAGPGWGLVTSFGAGAVYLLWRLQAPGGVVRIRRESMAFRWAYIAEFLRAGVPGMLNVVVNNLTVVVLTALAGRAGRDAAIAYGMGARLEYIVIPLAFGIGTGIVALVGTNLGAKQHERSRAAAWKGAAMAAAFSGAVGLAFALFPHAWMHLFTRDEETVRIGVAYLRIVGPCYALYGFGIGLYFACQGYGRVLPAVGGNFARLVFAAAAGWVALSVLEAGVQGLFVAIAAAFAVYAAANAFAVRRVMVQKS